MITESLPRTKPSDSHYFVRYARHSGLAGNECIIDLYESIADSLCRGYKIQEVGWYGTRVQDERDIDRCRRFTGDLIYGE